MKNIKRKKLGECFVDSIQRGKKNKVNLSACWWCALCLAVLLTLAFIALYVACFDKGDKVIANEPKVVGNGVLFAKNATISFYSEYDSCHTGESCLMANGLKAERG